jgi:hypothetical protein
MITSSATEKLMGQTKSPSWSIDRRLDEALSQVKPFDVMRTKRSSQAKGTAENDTLPMRMPAD